MPLLTQEELDYRLDVAELRYSCRAVNEYLAWKRSEFSALRAYLARRDIRGVKRRKP